MLGDISSVEVDDPELDELDDPDDEHDEMLEIEQGESVVK
jgi:hypothetical protein